MIKPVIKSELSWGK